MARIFQDPRHGKWWIRASSFHSLTLPSPARGDPAFYLKVRFHFAGVLGNLVPRMCRRLIRAGSGPSGGPWPYVPMVQSIRRPYGNSRKARMNPAGRATSVAPDPVTELSCSVVTDRSWWFAGLPRREGQGRVISWQLRSVFLWA
jgi:hypothetical protein